MGKPRRSFTLSEKQKAVAEYQSGKKTAKQIATEFSSSDNNLVHRWKYELETRNQGQRIEAPKGNNQASDAAKRIRELESEVLEYQKIVAEQAVILDLLKKHRTRKSSVFEKRSSGLTDIIKELDPKRKPQK
jgi:transposase-like protein